MNGTITRLGRAFTTAANEKRAALIAYITAGDPNPGFTAKAVLALERAGVDLIELGVPFSDPIADGPVIQRASDRALRAGTTVAGVLEIAAEIRKQSEIPLLLFSYLNPLLRYGAAQLASKAADVGVDGVLLTDLSVEEAPTYVAPFRDAGLDTVFLAAPTSTPERLKKVAEYSSGFIYLVSRTGVTGVQQNVSDSVGPLVADMRSLTDLPLAVGFGISHADQVKQVAATADGVVVGSAFVKLFEQHGADPDRLLQELETFARSLRGGTAK